MTNIDIRVGDLLESDAQTLTNTVNTVGVMGKGIALQFKKRFPDMYADYAHRCDEGTVRLGRPYLYKTLLTPWILNFPTKGHWRSLSRLDAIQEGLQYLANHYQEWGIESLAVPPLGCGEGGLEWSIVGPTLYRGLSDLDIPVELYAPWGTPRSELEHAFLAAADAPRASRVPPSGVALAAILDRIQSQDHHYPIGRISMQKIAYFATSAGIPTELEFERRPFGPFSTGLKALLSKLINNGLIEERQYGRMFVNTPGVTLEDAKQTFDADLQRWESEVERVADLFLRIPSTRQAELAASVHYIAESLSNRIPRGDRAVLDEGEVIAAVVEWKAGHDRPPTRDEIVGIARTLGYLGWIDARPSGEVNVLTEI